MKNKIFSIFLSIVLSLPISVWAVDNTYPEEVASPSETIEKIVEQSTEKTFKQPISKKKIAKKFLAAMGGVVASSVILYILLTLYNKLRDDILRTRKLPELEESLESPKDLTSALKTFLEKTNWGC